MPTERNPFQPDLRDIYTLYFWEYEQGDDPQKCFEAILTEAARIRKFCEQGFEPVVAKDVDRKAYLAAVRELIPSVKKLKLVKRKNVPTYTPYRHKAEPDSGPFLFNTELVSLYYDWGDKRWIPTEEGIEAWSERYGEDPSALKDPRWDRFWKAQEKMIRRYALLSLPRKLPGRAQIAEKIALDMIRQSEESNVWDTIHDSYVLPALEFNDQNFWNFHATELINVGDDFLGALGYHAACATFMGRPEVTKKIEAVMRFVRHAPGSPTYTDPTTWVAYVRQE